LEQPPVDQLNQEQHKVLRSLSASRIILPTLLGLVAVGYVFWRNFDAAEFAKIEWTAWVFTWIFIGIICVLIRDLAYAYRLRILTEGELSWRKCIEVVVIWEFSSAVSPSALGGSAVAFFILSQERLSVARTVTIVTYTIVLDALFMLLTLPILFMVFGFDMIRPNAQTFADTGAWGYSFLAFYGFMIFYSIVFAYGIFIGPKQMKGLLHWVTNNKLLRRFNAGANKLGEDLVMASDGLKKQSLSNHLQAMLGTLIAWVFRFLLISCLIIAFVPDLPLNLGFQFELYARLQSMFFMIMFSPTPGGAGVIELLFGGFLTDYINSKTLSSVISAIWRILSYYIYLIGGAIVVPMWIKKVLKKS
jgi:glycosyltransferase 2 family protein